MKVKTASVDSGVSGNVYVSVVPEGVLLAHPVNEVRQIININSLKRMLSKFLSINKRLQIFNINDIVGLVQRR